MVTIIRNQASCSVSVSQPLSGQLLLLALV
ncbi:hypothetical protein Nmel_013176, partial [Mimus melanotis]